MAKKVRSGDPRKRSETQKTGRKSGSDRMISNEEMGRYQNWYVVNMIVSDGKPTFGVGNHIQTNPGCLNENGAYFPPSVVITSCPFEGHATLVFLLVADKKASIAFGGPGKTMDEAWRFSAQMLGRGNK